MLPVMLAYFMMPVMLAVIYVLLSVFSTFILSVMNIVSTTCILGAFLGLVLQ